MNHIAKHKFLYIVVAALLLVSVVVLLFGHHTEPPLPFDPKAWEQADREGTNQRLRMVSDLKPKLMGMTKAQVEGMLGEPRKDVGYDYLLGTYDLPIFGPIDGIWLEMKYQNDRVKDVQVIRD